jgi:hypothetical protein
MSNPTRAPSPRQLQEAFSDLARTAQRLLKDDPNMPEEDRKLWQDMLEAESEGDPFRVLDRLVHAAVQSEHYAEGVRSYRTDLAARLERHMRAAERTREQVQRFLLHLNLPTLVRPTYSASISAGHRHVVPTREPAELPDRFRRASYEADRVALGAALRAGEKDVPAEWSNQEPTLTIRTR